jgi:alpha-tubulin suppressor-like RCC1 family protein
MKHSRSIVLLLTIFVSLACSTLVPQPPLPAPTLVPTHIPIEASTEVSTQLPSSNRLPLSISVGGAHVCALLNDGHVACWGDNSSGQLGDGTYTKHFTATEVPGLTDAISISAGGSHTCAVTQTGHVKCWGNNYSGQLGNGTKQTGMVPTEIPGLTDVVAISAGSEHTCAVLRDGGAKCWGKNLNGRVGDGSGKLFIFSPVDVAELGADIVSISAADEHTCALTGTGNVKCWGRNTEGQLGIGQETNRSKVPVEVININGKATALSTGFSSSCVVTNDGPVECWGWMGSDELSNAPVAFEGLDGNAKMVATGASHVCVVLESGGVKCMGENTEGQLGNGKISDLEAFVTVQNLPSDITEIGVSFDSTCALTNSGEIFCWGDNTSGELGIGTTEDSATPVKVIGINP